MRADSTAYVGVPITTVPVGVDLTDDTFEMAFVVSKDDAVSAGEWHTAIYDGRVVKMLVGPGGTVIPPGSWVVLVRIHDVPEVPVIPASGKFTITAVV